MADEPNIIALTADVVASYVGKNNVAPNDLPNLISTVHAALSGQGAPVEAAPAEALTRAQIRKSVTPNAIISFEDGKPYKSLKRHLATKGLTPAEYRKKWGLPDTYAMVAITYSEQRSRLAKALGLGRKAALAAPEPAKAPPAAKAARAPRKPRAAKAAAPKAAELPAGAIDPTKEEFT